MKRMKQIIYIIKKLWHIIGNKISMKVIKLNQSTKLTATEKFISAILKTDFDAFKATSRQFLRNNKAYAQQFTGFIA